MLHNDSPYLSKIIIGYNFSIASYNSIHFWTIFQIRSLSENFEQTCFLDPLAPISVVISKDFAYLITSCNTFFKSRFINLNKLFILLFFKSTLFFIIILFNNILINYYSCKCVSFFYQPKIDNSWYIIILILGLLN